MAHQTLKSSYDKLTDRINLFPQGAPPGKLLYDILRILFSEKEAELVGLLPIKPFTVPMAAKLWKKSESETQTILEDLASRGMLVDIKERDILYFVMPPPMAGFFEFSMMRITDRYDQKLLAELFYQYLNVEEDFVRNLFAGSETQLGRVFVNEKTISPENEIHVLDYERASNVIDTATDIGIGICYCRHKMSHLGKACNAPMDICMTFNSVASSLIRHRIARKIDKQECNDLLQTAIEKNLVQFGENVRQDVGFICNCCGCCCEALLAAKRFAVFNPIATTNFLPQISEESCNGCGRCATSCPVEAIKLVSSANDNQVKQRRAHINSEVCLGCGVCVRNCSKNAISLSSRKKRVITPLNTAHRVVLTAIEKGKLQNLIFDNQALWNHRVMATILGVVLKLPPMKQLLAQKQLVSRYLEYLLAKQKTISEFSNTTD